MQRSCKTFPTEYQYEFTKKKSRKSEPFRPAESWELVGTPENSKDCEEKAEKLLKKFALERYQTAYQLHYNKSPDEKEEEEEIDLGNELITYLKKLYYDPHTDKTLKQSYTTARVFGYVSPGTLHAQLSTYQDTYGRTGGKVILKNVQKMIAAKRRRIIQSKLQANVQSSH
ncbi:uncharacterized protein LOC103316808 [Nasonia vitripennis]|uniref:Uncharacterized protein n=1 Tax=Nasonia vitripennis TaxID=7425 RepID=A0A7M7IPZ9_NASVI|nr:uncharacterized protein LOC103316808 [Nasonia vitripennis]XP_016839800.1 uncharacterized protein LOC103316808 [Nasonia vitripennis]